MYLVVTENTLDKRGDITNARMFEDCQKDEAYKFASDIVKTMTLNEYKSWFGFTKEDQQLSFEELADKHKDAMYPYWFGYKGNRYGMSSFDGPQRGFYVEVIKIPKTVDELIKSLKEGRCD